MELEKFLEAVLPQSGDYFTAYITQSGTLRQNKHDSIEAVRDAIERSKKRRVDAYYATGSYDGVRKKTNTLLKKAFYVDIDCKEGGQYLTKKEAMVAIKAAIKNGLPIPSWIVDSGGGYHPYWVLTEAIPKGPWEQYSKALDKACEQTGLKVDAGITQDSARILRAPTSVNYKDPANPRACEVVWEHEFYSFDQISEVLNPFLTGPAATSILPDINGDVAGGLHSQRAGKASEMVNLCPLMKHTLDTRGAEQPGVLWHKVLHTLAFCEDGVDYIHAMSEGHDTYDPQAVERRFEHAIHAKKNPDVGPTTCDKFSEHAPQCRECEFRGVIKTPFKLAFGRPSELPWPYRNGEKHLEKYAGEEEWEFAARYRVKNFKAAVEHGQTTYINFEMDGTRLDTDLSHFVDAKSVSALLAKYALSMTGLEIEQLRQLIMAWISQLRENKGLTKLVKKYGWVDEGFNYGGVLHKPDGTETPTFRVDPVLTTIYEPVGDLDPWKECADHILAQPRPAAWCTIASSFAAPLIKFTGVRGAFLSIVSEESGTGKSTALRVAQAVWGHPTRGISALNDTANSVTERLGMLNTLPAYWDEVRGKEDVQNFLKMIFRLGQGRGKQRLTSSIQQRNVAEWETLLTVATNEPVRDHVAMNSDNSDAGAARIFEIFANVIDDNSMNDAEARHFYNRLQSNYGVAGNIYAKYLASNAGEVEDLVQKLDRSLTAKLETSSDERFWVSTMACLIAGAQLANKLELCNFNTKLFMKYLVHAFAAMREGKHITFKTGVDRAVDLLSRYLHEKSEYIIIAKHLPQQGRNSNNIILDSMRRPATARYCKEDDYVRLFLKDFEEWVYAHSGAGFSTAVKQLCKHGAIKRRGRVDVGAAYATGTKQWCLDIPLTSPTFKDVYVPQEEEEAISSSSDDPD